MKENIIGGIFDVLHWASWADYIRYIGLTPRVGTQCDTIPIYSNTEASNPKLPLLEKKDAGQLRYFPHPVAKTFVPPSFQCILFQNQFKRKKTIQEKNYAFQTWSNFVVSFVNQLSF
jgi:hypothetical protein